METEKIESVIVDLEWTDFLNSRLEDTGDNLVLGSKPSPKRMIKGEFYCYPIICRQIEKKPWPKWLVGLLGRFGIGLQPRHKVVGEEVIGDFAEYTTLRAEGPFVDLVIYNEDYLALFHELLGDYERIFAEDTRSLKVRLTLHTTQIRRRKGKPKEDGQAASEAEWLTGLDQDTTSLSQQAD